MFKQNQVYSNSQQIQKAYTWPQTISKQVINKSSLIKASLNGHT